MFSTNSTAAFRSTSNKIESLLAQPSTATNCSSESACGQSAQSLAYSFSQMAGPSFQITIPQSSDCKHSVIEKENEFDWSAWCDVPTLESLDRKRLYDEIMDFSKGQSEKFDLKDFQYLTELPDGLQQLKEKLSFLYIGNCPNLNHLPTSIEKLKKLKEIAIHDCNKLESLPSSIDALENLQTLRVKKCNSFKNFPVSIQDLKNLTKLSIVNCKKWEGLSESLCNLSSECSIFIYPDKIRQQAKKKLLEHWSQKSIGGPTISSSRSYFLKQKLECPGKLLEASKLQVSETLETADNRPTILLDAKQIGEGWI